MSVLTTILRAIGIYVVPPVYLDSLINNGDLGLYSEINNTIVLKSIINTDYDRGCEI